VRKSVWFENVDGKRRVIVAATVCMREGSYGLECLLCRNGTKEHESILTTNADAAVIHAYLMAAGGIPGSPVQYLENKGEVRVIPPSGSKIKVLLQYEQGGKLVTVPAKRWILDGKKNTELEHNWVFAGSHFFPNPDAKDKPPIYAATSDGAYICTSNVPSAMLELPIDSPNDPALREFRPFTDRIPALETKVDIILEPQEALKKPAQ
jgi:hypothetical protein